MGGKKKQVEKKIERSQKVLKLLLKDKNSSSWGLSVKKFILIIASLVATGILLTGFLAIFNANNRHYSVSEVLKKNVELNVGLLELQERIEEFFEEDQLVEYMKAKMRPIQERVASLITQTGQYEKLPHIPGGPTQFISSTLKELDSIEYNYLKEIGVEVMKKLMLRTLKAQDLETISKKIFQSSFAVLKSISRDATLSILLHEGVYLVPMSQEISEVSLENFDRSDIIAVHLELVKLFQNHEDNVVMISEYVEEHYPLHTEFWADWDPKEFSDDEEFLTLFYAFHEGKYKLEQEVKKNADKYPLLIVHSFQIIQRCKELISKLADYGQFMRAPYIKLQGLILSDIKKLRIRAENLKFIYAKKSYNN